MEVASLIALAQGIGVLIIAGLVWPLFTYARHTRQRRLKRIAPPACSRQTASFHAHHEG